MRIDRERFFGPNNGFRGRNFENFTLDLELALPRYHVCQFSVKTDNVDFFWPKMNFGVRILKI